MTKSKGIPQRFKHGHSGAMYKTGKDNPSWNGGIRIHEGYVQRLMPNHPFATKKGYVSEHRLVYEQYYNCILLPWAHIHHKNENRKDNRIENIEPVSHGQHMTIHHRVDMNGRYCVRCGSTTTAKKSNGCADWPMQEGKSWVCKRCYLREYHKNYKNKREGKFVTND